MQDQVPWTADRSREDIHPACWQLDTFHSSSYAEKEIADCLQAKFKRNDIPLISLSIFRCPVHVELNWLITQTKHKELCVLTVGCGIPYVSKIPGSQPLRFCVSPNSTRFSLTMFDLPKNLRSTTTRGSAFGPTSPYENASRWTWTCHGWAGVYFKYTCGSGSLNGIGSGSSGYFSRCVLTLGSAWEILLIMSLERTIYAANHVSGSQPIPNKAYLTESHRLFAKVTTHAGWAYLWPNWKIWRGRHHAVIQNLRRTNCTTCQDIGLLFIKWANEQYTIVKVEYLSFDKNVFSGIQII